MSSIRTLADITADEIDHILDLAGVNREALWCDGEQALTALYHDVSHTATVLIEPRVFLDGWRPFVRKTATGYAYKTSSLHPAFAAFHQRRVGFFDDGDVTLPCVRFVPVDPALGPKSGLRCVDTSHWIGPGYVHNAQGLCLGDTNATLDYFLERRLITPEQALAAYRAHAEALEAVVYDQALLLDTATSGQAVPEPVSLPAAQREVTLRNSRSVVESRQRWMQDTAGALPPGAEVLIADRAFAALADERPYGDEGIIRAAYPDVESNGLIYTVEVESAHADGSTALLHIPERCLSAFALTPESVNDVLNAYGMRLVTQREEDDETYRDVYRIGRWPAPAPGDPEQFWHADHGWDTTGTTYRDPKAAWQAVDSLRLNI